MKNRWINLLVLLLVVMIGALFWHLFVYAKTAAATSLILNILKPLNILLFTVLFYIISRNLIKLYLGQKRKTPGFRLRTKLVLAILPLTLVPALIIFFLSTRFLDLLLLSFGPEANIAEIANNAEALNEDYLEQVGDFFEPHADELAEAISNQDSEIQRYLDRFDIDGVEYYRNGRLEKRVLNSAFPPARLGRLESSPGIIQIPGPRRFDDGFLLVHYDFPKTEALVRMIYIEETPFTERFYYIRDTAQFLRHTQKKSVRIREINYGILLVTTLAVIFGGIWTGLTFARPFLNAFQTLISAASSVSAGDFSTQIELKTGDELEDVGEAFNAMTVQLKNNSEQLQRHARDLETVNAALSGQIQYNQTILQKIKAGIVSTDTTGVIQTVNPVAKAMLGFTPEAIHTSLEDRLENPALAPLLELWEAHIQKQFGEKFAQMEILDAVTSKHHILAVSLVPLLEEGKRFGSLLIMEDLTALLAAQKLAAWREVAKRVAHEIKNPLTPIQLSIQRIYRKSKRGAADLNDAIASAHDTIMGETHLLKNLVDEFSTFAKMPAPVKTRLDVTDLIKNVVESYAKVYSDREIQADFPAENVHLQADPSQIRQVLSNLINNAAQATQEGDAIRVRLIPQPETLVLEVSDEGTGIPDVEKAKVFLPYYSKSPKGTGLGLAIVKRIVNDHGGTIVVLDNHPKGTCFRLEFPTKNEHSVKH